MKKTYILDTNVLIHDPNALFNFEDNKFTEPKYFLPIIPLTLLWRTNSPGFGFSFRSFRK